MLRMPRMPRCLTFLIQDDQGSSLQVFAAAESTRDDTTFAHMDYSKHQQAACRIYRNIQKYGAVDTVDSSLGQLATLFENLETQVLAQIHA